MSVLQHKMELTGAESPSSAGFLGMVSSCAGRSRDRKCVGRVLFSLLIALADFALCVWNTNPKYYKNDE